LDIGKQIRKARRARGLTQEELARRANMSLNGLAQLEQGGRTDPHYSTLSKLATALDVSVTELLEEQRPLAVAR
jgi:transcriptional regulator with XRE-family HTH domain